jgi:hypothetical protein
MGTERSIMYATLTRKVRRQPRPFTLHIPEGLVIKRLKIDLPRKRSNDFH